jgi:hypothetical protein
VVMSAEGVVGLGMALNEEGIPDLDYASGSIS